MGPIKVPTYHRDSIRRIARLAPGEFEGLAAALEAASRSVLARSGLGNGVAEALTIDREAAQVLVDALIGAGGVRQRRNATAKEIAGAIAADATLKLEDQEAQALSQRLARLLDVPNVMLLTHAAGLLSEDDRTFCSARTLSDLRPVFDTESDPPQMTGVLIRHSLKIRVHTENDTESFFVTIDKRGLLDLREAIDRAIAKGEVLTATASGASLKLLDMEGSH